MVSMVRERCCHELVLLVSLSFHRITLGLWSSTKTVHLHGSLIDGFIFVAALAKVPNSFDTRDRVTMTEREQELTRKRIVKRNHARLEKLKQAAS